MKSFLAKYKKINYLLKALGILIVITIVSHLFRDHLDIINIALIHIIPVVVVAIHGKMKATFFMIFLSILFLSFLYIPPLYSFSVHNELYIWSFMIFAIVGWIITIQAKNLNTQRKQNELRESLLHIVSHDLRTPLSTIHGSINLILSDEKDLDKKRRDNLLEDINYASIRMERLITNILDSTRLSSGDIDLKLEWCDFEDIIGVALDEFQIQDDEKLVINIDELSLYWGDNALLTQLIINLFDNAFKYSKEDTKIVVDIVNKNNYLLIKIFNQSEYIDEEKLKNIFDKFYRLEDTNDISGSGIGLAICKSIVKLHGGEIRALPQNEGILIEIELPIIKRAKLI